MTYYKLIFFLMFNFLYATTYEDTQNTVTSQWQHENIDTLNSINKVYDKSKKIRVIEFQGAGTQQIYDLYTSELKNQQEHEYCVSWEMKFSEDFVIILQIQSNLGKHYLIYTPGTFNSYMQYGLGEGTKNGQWKKFTRNIQKDIAYFDNRVKIVSLKRFVVKGNGMIRNIQTILGSPKSNINNRKKNPIPEKKLIPEKRVPIEASVPIATRVPVENRERKIFKESISSLPLIKMKGKKVVKLKLGEPYIEEGVSAYDKEDGEIDVETIENIYINETGRYMILYMATDSDGNIAIDKRYVDVGDVKDVKIEKRETSIKKREEVSSEEDERGEPSNVEEEEGEEISELSKQAAQMRLWERKLELREKELAKRRE